MKGTLDLTPRSVTWEPETTPADPRAPYVISCWEGAGQGVVLRLSAKALSELEAAIATAREERKVQRVIRPLVAPAAARRPAGKKVAR